MLASDKLTGESLNTLLSGILSVLGVKFFLAFGLVTIYHSLAEAQTKTKEQVIVDSLNQLFREKQLSDFNQAKELVDQALTLAIETDYPLGQATARSNLGLVYFRNNNNRKAIEQYFAALQIYDEKNLDKNTPQYGLLFVRLAAAHRLEDHLEDDLFFLKKALSLGHHINDKKLLDFTYQGLGIHYTLTKDEDSALYHYEQALKYSNDEVSQANALNNMGVIYQRKGQFSTALDQYKKAYIFYRSHSLTTFYESSLDNIGEAYYGLGDYRLSIAFLDSAEYYAKHLPAPISLFDIYLHKSRSYHRLGNIDSTAYYLNKTLVLKDSLYNDKYKKELAAAKVRMDVYQTEVENKLLAKDKNIAILYRNLAIAALMILATILLFVLVNRRLRIQRRVNETLELKVKERTEEINRANLKLQLSLNRAGVNSHFVFNVLNSIQHMVLAREPLQAKDHLAKLSRLMRYVLEKSQLDAVPLEEEIAMIERYIQLEQVHLDDKFSYRIIIDTSEEAKIPAMLIQPYVENAILHGLAPADGNDLHLLLKFSERSGELLIEIEDNGVGRKINRPASQHVSFGSSLSAERLKILTSLNNKEFNVTVRDLIEESVDRKGTKVVLSLPMVRGAEQVKSDNSIVI